jgi:hypothetical protein
MRYLGPSFASVLLLTLSQNVNGFSFSSGSLATRPAFASSDRMFKRERQRSYLSREASRSPVEEPDELERFTVTAGDSDIWKEKKIDKSVGGYDPSERIGGRQVVVGDPQIKVAPDDISVTSILRELAAIQQQGPQKYCILGTRHCSFLHQQIIELL